MHLVPALSQQGGLSLSGPAELYSPLDSIHIFATSSQYVGTRVAQLLNEPVDSPEFAANGFPASSSTPSDACDCVTTLVAPMDAMQITSGPTSVQPGDQLTIILGNTPAPSSA